MGGEERLGGASGVHTLNAWVGKCEQSKEAERTQLKQTREGAG